MANYLLDGQTTERLYFRKFTQEDFKDWLPFYGNPASTQHWDGLPSDPLIACKEQFKRIFERYELGIGGMNALISKKDNRLIGMCGLLIQEVDINEELEIGYSVLPEFWRQGYAFEAAKKCKDFAFEHRLRDSLISIIQVDNIPSQKTALKNGMHLDKTTTYKNNRVHIFRVHRTKTD